MEEEALLTAIVAAPNDTTTRLVYADWLDERSDPRGAYLRREVEHFRRQPIRWGEWKDNARSPLWKLQKKLDPVWAARVSRIPFGILAPDLRFRRTGPKIGSADVTKIERRWRERLPADYVAFLLNFNGGSPSKPYLYSYGDYPEGKEEYYDAVRFFSTADAHESDRPWLTLNVVEAFNDHVSQRADPERLSRMIPIGAVAREDCDAFLALTVGHGEVFPRVFVVEYWPHSGVSEAEDVHWTDSFTSLLMHLCERRKERR